MKPYIYTLSLSFVGWRSNSRFNGGWNQYGELFCDTICFQVYLIARRETEENV
jgi:hypothetical protein